MQRGAEVGIVAIILVSLAAAGTYEYLVNTPPPDRCAGVQTAATYIPNSHRVAPRADSWDSVRPLVEPGFGSYRAGSTRISIVAAENFWGSLVAQLGGEQASVLSIVSDPNGDPHEYEANSTIAQSVASAQFVIVNGVGYDDWALQLIAADGNPNQIVLNVGDLNQVALGAGVVAGNPHMWYNPTYVHHTVAAMYSDLVSLRSSDTAYFQSNYAAINVTLDQLYGQGTEIRNRFAGTVVAATEDVFVYLANFTNLDLVSPPDFMEAVAEGNDPSITSVVQFQCQLESGKVRLLVYNSQTLSPVTTYMKSVAESHQIPVVAITETVQPGNATFQSWMSTEFLAVEAALAG